MRVIFMNSNGKFSSNQSPLFPKPVLFVGEEKKFSSASETVTINKISKIFDSKELTEISECFNQNFTRQFIALPGRKVIICSIFEKRKFSAPSLVSKLTNRCQKELEDEKTTSVLITVSYLSEDNKINNNIVSDTTLEIFNMTENLSKYFSFIEKLLQEL